VKIVLAAVISLEPFSPGMAWNWLQHAIGFRRLGHDVTFVEQVDPSWCVDAAGEPCEYERSVNRARFIELMSRFDLLASACQLSDGGERTTGLSRAELVAAAREADVLINMSGHVTADWVLESVRRRVYVDQDPVFTQLWHAEYGADLDFNRHDAFATVGLNIGTGHSPIPDCGLRWIHVLPPVVPDLWRSDMDLSSRRFTTVASWAGYKDLAYQGETYSSKYEEFGRFADLPERVGQELEVALNGYRDADRGVSLLRERGWKLEDARRVGGLDGYADYLRRSRAEIGVAKNAYVKGRSGWFSDRSAHYLASGKPVLAQSTGFEHRLPTEQGLLTFSTVDEAAEGVERINADYAAHCRAARAFAEEHLDYRKVLLPLLEEVLS
jgi:hypothetical protein